MRKIILVVLLALLAVASIFALIACRSDCYALGHDWGKPTVDIAATCAKDGKYVLTCKRCGEVVDGESIHATGEHAWQAGEITKEATCFETGSQIYECSVCQKQEIRQISLADHKYGELHLKIPATCLTEGRLAYYQCSVCLRYFDESFAFIGDSEQDLVISTAGRHTWLADEITLQPTCTEKGKQTYECSVCHVKESRDVERIAHSFGILHEEITPTCVDNGVRTYTQCQTCKQYFTEQGELIGASADDLAIPATGIHDFRAGEVTKRPTCAEKGAQIYECFTCHEQKSVELDKVDHEYGDLHGAVEPTCGRDGNLAYYQCSTCNEYFDIDRMPLEAVVRSATGEHSWIVSESDGWIWPETYEELLETGVKVNIICFVCNATEQHDATFNMDGERSREPTFEAEGNYVYTAELTIYGVILKDTVGKTYNIPKIPDGNPNWDVALLRDFDCCDLDDESNLMNWNPYLQAYEIRRTFRAGQSWIIKSLATDIVYDGNNVVSLTFNDGLEQPSTHLYSILSGDDVGVIEMLYDAKLYITINEQGEISILVEEVDLASKIKECYFSGGINGEATDDPNYKFMKQSDGTYTLDDVTLDANVENGLCIKIFYDGAAINYTDLEVNALENDDLMFSLDRRNGCVRVLGEVTTCTINLIYNPNSNTLTIVVVAR